MRARQNIVEMSPKDLERYRKAVREVQSLSASDQDSYAALAALHAQHCQHGNILFLPWHRAYLLRFEAALQRFDPSVAIPYWNWREHNIQGPPPPVFYDEKVEIDGHTAPNPLWLPRINFPRSADEFPSPKEWPDLLKASPSWSDFSASFERMHNKIHRWASQEMADLMGAPRDPIFWSHHAFIDFLWSRQQGLPGREPRGRLLNDQVPGLQRKVGDLLSIEDCGYEYSIRTDILPGSILEGLPCNSLPLPPKAFHSVRIETRATPAPVAPAASIGPEGHMPEHSPHGSGETHHPSQTTPEDGASHAGHEPDHRTYCILVDCAPPVKPTECICQELTTGGSTLPNGQPVGEVRIVYLP